MVNGKQATRARRKVAERGSASARSADMPLREYAEAALDAYFQRLNGHRPSGLYQLVLREVEEPLFRSVMQYTEGNQLRAAEILGINRGTLRRKLEDYGLVD
jgi:Fis family transcriptional regulator, factor for inversion stimulation protein